MGRPVMSRHGLCDDLDDNWDLIRWRGRVASAIRGKRGQALIRDLRDALDAMPEKRLITEELVNGDGDVCSLGSVGVKRGVAELPKLDPEDHEHLGSVFNVAPCLIMEIEFLNDEGGEWKETPEKRWERMRKWCDKNLAKEAD